jgi:hypothetical protein
MGKKIKQKHFPVLPFLGFFGIVFGILGYQYNQYGATLFFRRSQFDSDHTASEWHKILENKTVLLIGGPHRGGTTLLWNSLDAHPDISGLATTPPDEGNGKQSRKRKCREGILIQDVYSRFGIGIEDIMKKHKVYQQQMLGVGRYALGNEKDVHLTESDAQVSPENMARLLNRYSYYWNFSKSVVAEKSPPNAVISRFLQALYNAGRNETSIGLQTKFLFVTRHPIANTYALQSILEGVYDVPFAKLMDNYVQLHRYLTTDLPHLENHPILIKLEDFAANPLVELQKIYSWLGVDSSSETVQDIIQNGLGEGVLADPNAKYRKRWCDGAGGTNGIRQETIARKYQPLINELGLGYELEGWCSDS